jgi:hypothetical protein
MFWNKKEEPKDILEIKELMKTGIMGLVMAMKADIAIMEEAEKLGKLNEKEETAYIFQKTKMALRDSVVLTIGLFTKHGDVFDESNKDEKETKRLILEMYEQLRDENEESAKKIKADPEKYKEVKKFWKNAGLGGCND